MADLNVFMVGGRRCGKSSALASLFYEMINGPANQVFTIYDRTRSSDAGAAKESLEDKRSVLSLFIETGGNKTFLVDESATQLDRTYTLKLKIPHSTGKDGSLEMDFYDIPGEWFREDTLDPAEMYVAENQRAVKVNEYWNNSDVVVVVVDTPYLMQSKANAEAAGLIFQLHRFFGEKIGNDQTAKMVIFVPIKCERWMHEGKINLVCDKIEEYYKATITHLKTYNTEIMILPIETAGDIEFSHLATPYLLANTANGTQTPCSKVDDKHVILRDGTHHCITEDEVLQMDIDRRCHNLRDSQNEGPDYEGDRKSAWFRLRRPDGRTPEYSPHNCDQLGLHILYFMFRKRQAQAKGGLLGSLLSFIGRVSQQDMTAAINILLNKEIIKGENQAEGIRILSKATF